MLRCEITEPDLVVVWSMLKDEGERERGRERERERGRLRLSRPGSTNVKASCWAV
jgi:hypothetical protein